MAAIEESLEGFIPFLMYYIPAIVVVLVFMWIYTKLTKFDEVALIKENNSAAAVTYVGTMLGFALPISSALANSVSLIDFGVWAFIASVSQLATYQIFRKFYPLIDERVTRGEMAASLKLAGISLMVGMLNAAAITY